MDQSEVVENACPPESLEGGVATDGDRGPAGDGGGDVAALWGDGHGEGLVDKREINGCVVFENLA